MASSSVGAGAVLLIEAGVGLALTLVVAGAIGAAWLCWPCRGHGRGLMVAVMMMVVVVMMLVVVSD